MHSLEQLRRGELAGARRLDLSAGLTHFPEEIYALADTLEVLNLSGNQLDTLPADLSRLHRLRILFCSDNGFRELPECLGDCQRLEMVGFKANRIERVPAAALPPSLRWLILTDNRIEELPSALGLRANLQKLMLAGNRLSALPEALAGCDRLELLRIAANRLPALPDWLLELPNLAWLAFGGNPPSDRLEQLAQAHAATRAIEPKHLRLGPVLGEGASGVVQRADWHPDDGPGRPAALKRFKGAVTSDGLPRSEMAACIAAGPHPHLLPVIAPLASPAEPALLMELLDPRYAALAAPPSFASCTRDCYAEGRGFTAAQVVRIASAAASAVAHLHRRGILHGDLYAHNLLVDESGDCRLSDFGAASFFDPSGPQGGALQRLEARAFGHLLDELLLRLEPDHDLATLALLRDQCLATEPMQRPDFQTLEARIAALRHDLDDH